MCSQNPQQRRHTAPRLGRLSGKCNTFSKDFVGHFPAETFSETIIDEIFDKLNIFICNRPEIKALRKEESNDLQCAEKVCKLIRRRKHKIQPLISVGFCVFAGFVNALNAPCAGAFCVCGVRSARGCVWVWRVFLRFLRRAMLGRLVLRAQQVRQARRARHRSLRAPCRRLPSSFRFRAPSSFRR